MNFVYFLPSLFLMIFASASASKAMFSSASATASSVHPSSSGAVSGGGSPGGGLVPFPLSSAIVTPQEVDSCRIYKNNLHRLVTTYKLDSLIIEVDRAAPCTMTGLDFNRRLWIARVRMWAFLEVGRYSETIALADSMLSHWPVQLTFDAESVPLIIEYRGRANYLSKRYLEALPDLARALSYWPRLDATRAELSANLGWALFRTGKAADAFCRFVQTRAVIQAAGNTAHNRDVLEQVHRGLAEVAAVAVLRESDCRGTVYETGHAIGPLERTGLALAALLCAAGLVRLGWMLKPTAAPRTLHPPAHSREWTRATPEED